MAVDSLSLFHSDLILFDVSCNGRDELLKVLSRKFRDLGYVKDTFEQAVIERENTFPTGLPTDGVKVALPHTYPQHVNKPGILIANLKNPVNFKEMGNGVNDIPAELVFMLAVDQPEKQLSVLQKFMNIFMKKGVLQELKAAHDANTVLSILHREFN